MSANQAVKHNQVERILYVIVPLCVCYLKVSVIFAALLFFFYNFYTDLK